MQRMRKRCFKSINGLINKFPIVYQFCKDELNKFVLFLREGVYPYEDMDSWEKLNETSLPEKKAFYNNLNLEDITDKDYAHAQKVCEVFEIKDRCEYHDLYVQYNTLLLVDVFGNFRDKCIKIYKLDPTHFLSVPRLAWLARLKKNMGKIRIINKY